MKDTARAPSLLRGNRSRRRGDGGVKSLHRSPLPRRGGKEASKDANSSSTRRPFFPSNNSRGRGGRLVPAQHQCLPSRCEKHGRGGKRRISSLGDFPMKGEKGKKDAQEMFLDHHRDLFLTPGEEGKGKKKGKRMKNPFLPALPIIRGKKKENSTNGRLWPSPYLPKREKGKEGENGEHSSSQKKKKKKAVRSSPPFSEKRGRRREEKTESFHSAFVPGEEKGGK